MAAKLRLKPEQRGEALFLLDKGFTVDRAARALQEIHHPEHPLEAVKRAYFPARGTFAIHNFEGKVGGAIAQRYFDLVAAARVYSDRLKGIKGRPDVAVKMFRNASERMRRFNLKPGVVESSSKRLAKRWRVPGFRGFMRSVATRARDEHWKDPLFRAAELARLRVYYLTPGLRQRLIRDKTERSERYWAKKSPGAKEAHIARSSKVMQKLWKEPGFGENLAEARRTALRDPVRRARFIERITLLHSDPVLAAARDKILMRFAAGQIFCAVCMKVLPIFGRSIVDNAFWRHELQQELWKSNLVAGKASLFTVAKKLGKEFQCTGRKLKKLLPCGSKLAVLCENWSRFNALSYLTLLA